MVISGKSLLAIILKFNYYTRKASTTCFPYSFPVFYAYTSGKKKNED